MAVSSLGQFSTYSNQMNQLDRLQATSAERLTTGLRINSSADDAAGLAISSGMESVVRAASLVQDFMDEGEAMLNATEGVLASLESLSQRMRELTLQSMSGSLGDADRTLLQLELQSLSQGFNQMAMGFEYNAQPLLSEASKLTIPSGPYLGDELTVSFESFANDIVGSHHFKVDAAGGIPAQTLTIQSDYHQPVTVNIPAGQTITQVVDLINKAAAGVSFEARSNDVESFTRTLSGSFYSGLSAGDLTFSVLNPFFEETQSIGAFDASSSNSSAFAAGLQTFANQVVANAPAELQMDANFAPPSYLYSYSETIVDGTVPSQTVTLTGYNGQASVTIPPLNKTSLDTQSVFDAFSAITATTGVSANPLSHSTTLRTNGTEVDFEVTTKDGSFAVAQTFNQTPDADGYLNNDTNWADLKSQLDAIPGVSASIINRTWTTGVAPALVFHSEASYLSISLSTSTGVWFENTTQSVNENWSLSGTSMNTAGKSYLSIPGVMFNDASGQNPSAFRVDTSGATSKSLVDFTTPRISVSRLTLDGIEAPFTLTGTGGVLSGSLSATSAGVTQTGISFDAWHPYEITTTDASGSLFQSLVNHSHLKPLDEVDLTDVSELDDALVVMDKTLERIVYQRQQDGIGIEKMRISGRLMAEQGAQIKQVQSNIQDADYAVEIAQLAKSQILKSASSSMMAHEIDRIKKSVEYFFNGTK